MEDNQAKMTRPLELAERLEAMARQLREGQYEIQGRRWPVPETLKSKIKVVEKKGRLQTRLKFQWSTVDHYAPPEKAALKDWELRFKTVKKQLARSFKALSEAAGRNRLPEPPIMDQYMRDSASFEAISSTQWPEEMAVYRDHVQNMQRAVDDGRLADFQHEVRDLRAAMRVCHRSFK